MIELQFINYILDSKDTSLITLNRIDSTYFSEYKNEWDYISNHIEKYGNVPDKESFLHQFPKFDIVKVAETPKYLIEELFKNYKENQLALAFNTVRKQLIAGETEKALDTYKKTYEKLSTTGVALSSVDILKDTSRYTDYE